MSSPATIFRGKTLLIVGTGSPIKRFIFQKLHKLGLKLVVLNTEKNWAGPYVHDWILGDMSQHERRIAQVLAYRKSHKIDGLYNFWENDVVLTSKLAEALKFIGVPVEVAKIVRNKFTFRQFCLDHGVAAPKFQLLANEADVARAITELQFPVVVKPAWGGGSILVVKANNPQELKETFEYVRKTATPELDSQFHDGVDIMVEEYIDGDEVDIDMIVQNGRIKYAAVADNYGTAEPFFLETTHAMPSSLPEDDQDALKRMASDVLEHLGLQFGTLHFEAKITKKGPVPLECNVRMGADEIYISSKEVFGVDLIECGVRVALGDYVPTFYGLEPKKQLMTEALHAKQSGVLTSVRIDEARQKELPIEQFYFGKEIGETVLIPPDGYDYLGYITVSGDNFSDAQENLKLALKTVEYEVAPFDGGSTLGKTNRTSRFASAQLRRSLRASDKIERIRHMSLKDQRKLHIGIACNSFDGASGAVEQELSSVGRNIQSELEARGYTTTYVDFNNLSQAIRTLQTSGIDLVFNVCERIHESSLLEPHAAAILDAMKLPYTGSNPLTLGLCIDKIRVKKLLNYHSIPTPRWDYIYEMSDEIRDDLRYPLIVKPANTDNSIGIDNDSVVENEEKLKEQLERVVLGLHRPALVEEYIEGDEYDVPIIGTSAEDLEVLPLSRTIFSELPEGYWHIYPFDVKFAENKIYKDSLIIQEPPQKVSRKLLSLISEIALDTYNILDAHDYGRVEIKVDKQGNPFVLELNPNPSINRADCLPRVYAVQGKNYGDFLEKIISLTITRYKGKEPFYHLQTSVL
ncbi:MAG: ATP-grasp domain-containing protein [Candidatus Pacebacteria bacterium]|nr:ATP-grasp domain-containing protein [Candidatus Paceibacterota bacterium]